MGCKSTKEASQPGAKRPVAGSPVKSMQGSPQKLQVKNIKEIADKELAKHKP